MSDSGPKDRITAAIEEFLKRDLRKEVAFGESNMVGTRKMKRNSDVRFCANLLVSAANNILYEDHRS